MNSHIRSQQCISQGDNSSCRAMCDKLADKSG